MTDMLKCYVLRKTGKLDAWVAGRLLFGPRIKEGAVTLFDGAHQVDPNFFFRVDYRPWWVPPLFPKREIFGELWAEGNAAPIDIRQTGLPTTTALDYKLAKQDRRLNVFRPALPQMMLFGLVGIGALVLGFIMGKL